MKRALLATLALGALGGANHATASPDQPASPSMPPPNILLIICDDLNDAVSGMGRVPSAATPNLDRLGERGVRFLNASVNSAICLPSRNSLLSGLHPHTMRHYALYDLTPENPAVADAAFLPGWLRANGYATFGCGKVFHGGDSPGARFPARSSQWDTFHGGPNYGPFPYDAEADHRLRKLTIHPRQAWLLDHEDLPALEERFFDPFWMIDNDGMKFPFEHGFAPIEDVPPGGWHQMDGTPFAFNDSTDRDLLEDEQSARFAADILAAEQPRPFFLGVGFIRPHTPLYVPKEFFDRFPPESIQLPPVKDDELAQTAPAHRDNRPYGRLRWEMHQPGGEPLWREWLQAYLASIAFMDHQLGVILDALDNGPHAENTIVIFTSDNGYHMGDKDSLFKDTLWEGATRVPLVWAGPGIARGASSSAPVSLLDIYPTLLDLTGLPGDPHADGHGLDLDGHSLAGLLASPDQADPGHPGFSVSSVLGVTGLHHAIRTATHRYILCANGEEELYDHATDPLEHRNLLAPCNLPADGTPPPDVAKTRDDLKTKLQAALARYNTNRRTLGNHRPAQR